MTIFFDHHIVPSTDKARTARFYADILGLPDPREEGPFAALDLGNDVALYVAGWEERVLSQHYAFLVSEAEFDAFYRRLTELGLPHWADPHCRLPQQVNHDDGGRGTYFHDPDGHFVEVLTVRYGGRPTSVAPVPAA
jgi:catechol 2,3-dioxygenase-like lactoylglutathione lyase family enzyme